VPYYHVTFDHHVPSILRHGLGGRMVKKNQPDCAPGVYLSTDVAYGLTMMIEFYLRTGEEASDPRDYLASLRIIVIDDSRIDPKFLVDDESFPGDPLIRRYLSKIDVTSMPILTIDDVTPEEYKVGGVEYEKLQRFISAETVKFIDP
jgi:hypothetical protein